jgi:hypothetical protein
LSVVLKKTLSLPLDFYLNSRILKIIIASSLAWSSLSLWSMVDFFTQSIWLKALILGSQMLGILVVYALSLLFFGERSAVEGFVSKFLKKVKRS